MDLTRIDFDRLKEDLGRTLADGLMDLVDGAQDDVQAFASDISRDLLLAGLQGNLKVQAQLLDQLKILAEINRVRVENHAWVVVGKIARVAIEAAVAGAAAVFL